MKKLSVFFVCCFIVLLSVSSNATNATALESTDAGAKMKEISKTTAEIKEEDGIRCRVYWGDKVAASCWLCNCAALAKSVYGN